MNNIKTYERICVITIGTFTSIFFTYLLAVTLEAKNQIHLDLKTILYGSFFAIFLFFISVCVYVVTVALKTIQYRIKRPEQVISLFTFNLLFTIFLSYFFYGYLKDIDIFFHPLSLLLPMLFLFILCFCYFGLEKLAQSRLIIFINSHDTLRYGFPLLILEITLFCLFFLYAKFDNSAITLKFNIINVSIGIILIYTCISYFILTNNDNKNLIEIKNGIIFSLLRQHQVALYPILIFLLCGILGCLIENSDKISEKEYIKSQWESFESQRIEYGKKQRAEIDKEMDRLINRYNY